MWRTTLSIVLPLVNFLFPQETPHLQFELRHQHALSPDGHTVFANTPYPSNALAQTTYTIPTKRISTFRPPSLEAHDAARIQSIRHAQSADLAWSQTEILGPDVERRDTLLELAKMTNNAYLPPNDTAWYALGDKWKKHTPFGWEPNADGLRGYVFATPDNKTVVLAIKGTSVSLFGAAGPTGIKDRLNDNLLFSCCCARIDWTWTSVCGCHRGGWHCDQTCLERTLMKEGLYYPIGINLYNNLTYMYPTANIWVVGHSLGGALASLLGITFGVPVVAFESPGERLAATRLHLPSPPSTHHVTHVYHTADPVAMGTCNGILSVCTLGGYAMETKCHLGKSIVYDTVTNLSWLVDVRTHSIASVIDNILSKPWKASLDCGREVPLARPEKDCVECFSWNFSSYPPAQ